MSGPVSTTVGDHVGIPGVVLLHLHLSLFFCQTSLSHNIASKPRILHSFFFAALLKSKSEVPYQFQFQALGFFTPVLLLITNHTLTPCAIVGIQEANVILVAITIYLTHQFLNFYCLYLCYHPFFVCLTN